tara:strand:- start:1143 stop:2240 length:1098 start_codon:yes stop_codon:yes gene_type:complete
MRSNLSDKKAQMWFGDFVIAMIIASLMLVSYYAYTTNISKQDSVVLNDLVSDSKLVSSSFLSGGFPDEWNNATVKRIGLTNDNYRINESKLRRLSELSYEQSKKILGTVHDFFVFFEDEDKNLIPIGTECGYGDANVSANKNYKLAAYFNQGENQMEDEMDELEQKLGIDIYRDWSSANDMFNNISTYDFVLMENPKFSTSQASKMEDYVSSKGFVFISESMLNPNTGNVLGVDYNKRNCKKAFENVSIIHDDLFLTLKVGDYLIPEDCPYISGSVTTIGQFKDGTISIAKWDYGNGSVYYFSDFDVEFVGDLQGSIKDAFEASILSCDKSSAITVNATYDSLVKTERFLIFDSQPAKMVLYLFD